MTYKIALSGAQGTGKTQIVNELQRLLKADHFTVGIIESPTRFVKSLGFNLNQGGDWRTQLFSVVHRETRQLEALRHDYDFILADRFILDEMAYTDFHMRNRTEPADPEVASLFGDHLVAVQHMTAEFLDDDLDKYWDKVYFKPAHPDFPPEGDGDREASLEFQKAIEKNFRDLITYFNLSSRVEELEEDLYAAVDQIWSDPAFVAAREKAWS